MTDLTIETLKQICDKVPDDYTLKLKTSDGTIKDISDNIEVDISNKMLIFHEW